MDEDVQWTADQPASPEVVECSFQIRRAAGIVPGVLWLPSAPGPAAPLVLLGHGGSGHKRSEQMTDRAVWFASRARIAVLAIDGPYHGDRVTTPLSTPEYQARIAAEGIETVLDRMTADWRAAIAAAGTLGTVDTVDTANLGYLGMSLGTRFGLPLAAALGSQLRCAVLGKFGLRPGAAMRPALAAPERLARDARRITAPVLFHVQWDDGIFPRDGQLALFDLLGTADKRLIAFPGAHHETRPAALGLWRDFIVSQLAPRA
jgi:dienelactone hydrolase